MSPDAEQGGGEEGARAGGSPATGEPRLGDRLLERGLITRDQLADALARQETSGRLLGEILVETGALGQEELNRVLAASFGIPEVEPGELRPRPEALALVPRELAEEHALLPLRLEEDSLVAATPDPLDAALRDDLQRRTERYVDLVWAPGDAVARAIERHYPGGEEVEAIHGRIDELIAASVRQVRRGREEEEAADLSAAAPVVELIDELLRLAVRRRASDLHVEPTEGALQTRLRVDGVLREGPELPAELRAVVTTRLKIVGGMDISESRLPQDGRAVMEIEGRRVDLRLSSFPEIHGENMVVRLLQKERLVRGLEELGMSREQLERYRELLRSPHGIVLVTGPTGSGKTTTLYSTLAELDARALNIVTIEDPVEYELEGIRQSQINVRAGLTFARGLRSILRQDPDVILVGEIRDEETMEIAVRAALTGHLVFSTLHTNDAAGAIPRLLNMGAEPYLLGSSLVCVVAQRLVRLLCPSCRRPGELSEGVRDELRRLGLEPSPEEAAGLRAPDGCPECEETGFRGRVGVFELLEVGSRVQELVLELADAPAVREAAREEGMRTMLEEGLRRAFAGETTVDEVLKVAT